MPDVQDQNDTQTRDRARPRRRTGHLRRAAALATGLAAAFGAAIATAPAAVAGPGFGLNVVALAPDGSPLAGAVVTASPVDPAEGHPQLAATTDSDGRARIPGNEPSAEPASDASARLQFGVSYYVRVAPPEGRDDLTAVYWNGQFDFDYLAGPADDRVPVVDGTSGTPVAVTYPDDDWTDSDGWIDIFEAAAVVTLPAAVAAPGDGPDPTPTADPTVTPVPDTALTDAVRGGVSVPATATTGATVTVTVGAAHAGDRVSVWGYSTPIDLGWHTVAADGTVRVTLPAGLTAGAHRIAVLDAAGALIGWDDITLTAASNAVPRAATGLDETSPAPIAGLVVAGIGVALTIGAALTVRRRTQEG